MANAAKAKAAGIAPFMLSNQKKWPAQFMWSAMMVNKYGLDAYQGLIDNKIPWTDPRAVDITAMMKKLADDGMFDRKLQFDRLRAGAGSLGAGQGSVLV